MLRAERTPLAFETAAPTHGRAAAHQMLLAVATPPSPPAYALSGWPTWLIPAYRAGGHRPQIHLLEEER